MGAKDKTERRIKLDFVSDNFYNETNFTGFSANPHGGVTVSTGIVEAVEAYRGSYRPR